MKYRVEHDTMGEVKVPADCYWGAQTQRSYDNFAIGDEKMPVEVIYALVIEKKAAASVNNKLGLLETRVAECIQMVCDEILEGKFDNQFPLVVYQTGSGTQSNMNVNEVIANRCNEILGEMAVHPNDHVNKSQSSNDTFPTAMHISALLSVYNNLIPSVRRLASSLKALEDRYMNVVKIGRTHLQDAVPLSLGQEISGWRSMMDHSAEQIMVSSEYLKEIALGGTAVGTGLNAHKDFAVEVAEEIKRLTGIDFYTAPNKFHSLTSKDALITSHGAIKGLAANLMKIANDVRLLSSGPRCGIGEIIIPENEPGSSIMPGKINPTQCEALTMVAVRVIGNDTSIGVAGSQGNFELNVYMPVLIYSYLESVRLLSDAILSFEKNCISGIKPNRERINENLEKSLMLVTVLNPYIGYEKAAKVAKKAFSEGISLRESCVQLGYLTSSEFDMYVKPENMI